MSKTVGYVRVSTIDQNPQLQFDAINATNPGIVFIDYASGSKENRPELSKALEVLKPGDRLVVWKLDRLGRSTSHLLSILSSLQERGVCFVSLTEGMDTTTPIGKMVFTVTAAFAEFERNQIIERTLAGQKASRAKGIIPGRKTKVTPLHITAIQHMKNQGLSHAKIAVNTGLSKSVIGRVLRSEIQQLAIMKPLNLNDALPIYRKDNN